MAARERRCHFGAMARRHFMCWWTPLPEGGSQSRPCRVVAAALRRDPSDTRAFTGSVVFLLLITGLVGCTAQGSNDSRDGLDREGAASAATTPTPAPTLPPGLDVVFPPTRPGLIRSLDVHQRWLTPCPVRRFAPGRDRRFAASVRANRGGYTPYLIDTRQLVVFQTASAAEQAAQQLWDGARHCHAP